MICNVLNLQTNHSYTMYYRNIHGSFSYLRLTKTMPNVGDVWWQMMSLWPTLLGHNAYLVVKTGQKNIDFVLLKCEINQLSCLKHLKLKVWILSRQITDMSFTHKGRGGASLLPIHPFHTIKEKPVHAVWFFPVATPFILLLFFFVTKMGL